MIVYFEDSYGYSHNIGQTIENDPYREVIFPFLEKHHYNPPYVREWNEDGKHYFDVGSHSEFFFYELYQEEE